MEITINRIKIDPIKETCFVPAVEITKKYLKEIQKHYNLKNIKEIKCDTIIEYLKHLGLATKKTQWKKVSNNSAFFLFREGGNVEYYDFECDGKLTSKDWWKINYMKLEKSDINYILDNKKAFGIKNIKDITSNVIANAISKHGTKGDKYIWNQVNKHQDDIILANEQGMCFYIDCSILKKMKQLDENKSKPKEPKSHIR